MLQIAEYKRSYIEEILSKQEDLFSLNFADASFIHENDFLTFVEFSYESSAYEAFVLLDDEKLVGFYQAGFYPSHSPMRLFTLTQMYVDTECRGKGYGKKLIQHFEDLAKTKYKQDLVTLQVSKVNEQAVNFYKRNGYMSVFEEVEGGEVRYFMKKDL